MSTLTDKKTTIPTEYLPENWCSIGAELFGLKEETIRKIVFGHRQNAKVFDHFLDIAVKAKAQREEKLKFLNA